MGWAIDWSREFATCDPAYYKWNQWFFLKMLEKGIAYRKTGVVNWDPVDQTVLANEQVIDGRGWRSGAPVEKREIPMYYLRITDYAEELLDLPRQDARLARAREDDAGELDRQERGRALRVPARHPRRRRHARSATAACTCSRRAPTRSWASRSARSPPSIRSPRTRRRRNPKLAAFVDECKRGSVTEADLATMEKKGMPTGLFVTHPLTGEQIEVWVGNYVLMGYGDGAVMGVPAHDERDFAFAKKYGLPIRQVIAVDGEDVHRPTPGSRGTRTRSAAAASTRASTTASATRRRSTRSPPISRRRAWARRRSPTACATGASPASATGARRSRSSIATACGDVPVPEKDLPVVLPEDCVPDGSGNPLAKRADFLERDVPEVRQAGAARDRHDGHLRRLVVVLHALRVPGRADDGRRAQRLLDADGPVHRRHRARDPAPALRALLDQGDARPGPREDRRAVHAAPDAGHGAQPHLLPPHRRRAASTTSRPTDVDVAARRRRPHRPARASSPTASRSSTAASARCRSRSTTASTRRT